MCTAGQEKHEEGKLKQLKVFESLQGTESAHMQHSELWALHKGGSPEGKRREGDHGCPSIPKCKEVLSFSQRKTVLRRSVKLSFLCPIATIPTDVPTLV